MSISLNDISKKVMLFAAVVGATGVVAGASVLAQSQQPNGSNGRGNSYAANQCKNGGWEELGYENQGQCVADMVRGSKNTTNVNVSNSSSQSASSGNARVSGNSNGGSASSGNASNSSSSSSTVQVSN